MTRLKREATPSSSLVYHAVCEIMEHFAEIYGIEELADALFVSKRHLHRVFLQELNITPGRYLTSVRICHAKKLLTTLEFKLDIIAALCGFSSGDYLGKVFRQETGITPGEWRHRNSSTQSDGNMTEEIAALYL